ncbi:hypothetical protein EZV62_000313 [Acer yangbiense]|uniref:AIG1-type G domain-containing protein n=1 Tax=Acer yangbiense TaxID=1000413 RepID=A0A5C7ISE1_9ROSI|nr:hypothetical protein EZV62_000313 [Acer yangbiense]
MDSSNSKPRVSLPATTKAVQQVLYPLPHHHESPLSSSSSTGSFLIRAPLTVDDDDDDDDDDDNGSDFESNGGRIVVTSNGDGSSSTSSVSSSDNEGFVSGEEFETASEKHFVTDPDEEILEDNGFFDRYKISRPVVPDPDEEFSQNSSFDDEESGGAVDEYESTVVPVARLSMEDDGFDELIGGDEGMVSEVEDGGFSGLIKVPSVVSIERVDSVPRIKVTEIEGEDEPLSPVKIVESSDCGELIGVENGGLSDSEVTVLVKDSANEDDGIAVTQGDQFESSVGGKEDVFEVVNDTVEERLEFYANERIESNGWDGDDTKEHSAEEAAVDVDAEESSYIQSSECSSVDVHENVLLDEGGEKGNTESKVLQDVELGDYLYDPLAIISSKSVDGVIRGKETQTGDSQFSEPIPTLQNGDLMVISKGDGPEDADSSSTSSLKFVKPSSSLDGLVKTEAEDDIERIEGRQKGLLSDEDVEELIFGSSELIMNGSDERLAFQDHSQTVDGQIVMDSDGEMDTDGDGEGNELFDSAALAALLKAATGADSDGGGGGLTIKSSDGSKVFTFERPTNSDSLLFPSTRSAPAPNVDGDECTDDLNEEEKRIIDKIQHLRVKFLRLVKKLGLSADDPIVAQVLYRLALALGSLSVQAYSLESAKRIAMQQETEGEDDLDFSLNILVLGKTGVGKSATINSIFSKETTAIDAFEPATTSVKVIVETIDGIKIRILDTPGFRSPVMQQIVNRKILASIKKSVKKFPPDVVLYVDRLDTHTRDHSDLPLLKSITASLGSSIWQNAIVSLTHAASDPPDGPSGSPLSYEVFVAQRSHVIRQSISRAIGDLRMMNQSMMHPVSLVENHPSCQKNGAGDSVLPNGQTWRPQLLLLCYSLRIISEANSVLKPQGPFNHKKPFGYRLRSAPLSYLLSSLLQSRSHPKLSADQGGGDDIDFDIELGNLSDSNQEDDEDEYSQLPPFKPLRKSQVAKLSKEQRKAYLEEYDYRIKLLQKKQWKEEVRRLREIKKKGGSNDDDYNKEDVDQEDETPATVPVTLPDFVLPPSFDGDNPVYRYRFLEPAPQLLMRPVLDSHGWDHDCGYDGVSIERSLAIASQFPGAFSIQITKDKKEFNIHLDSSVAAKHGESGSTMAGLDIQTVGSQLAYILKGDTEFKNFKINKTSAGLSVTLLGENVATGVKMEDTIAVGKRLVLIGNAGAMRSQGDTAYGATLEVRLKDKDFPIEQDNSSFSLSMMNWRGDSTLMANLQSQFSIGRGSKLAVSVGLNNKRSGQITVKLSSSEQLQMALIGILPIAMSIFKGIFPGSGGKNSAY